MRSKLWSLRRLAFVPFTLCVTPSDFSFNPYSISCPTHRPRHRAGCPCSPTAHPRLSLLAHPGIPGDIPAITTSASMDRPFVQTAPNSPEAMEVDVDIPEVSRIPSAEDRFEAHSQASPSPRSAPLAQRIKASPHLPTPQRSVVCPP